MPGIYIFRWGVVSLHIYICSDMERWVDRKRDERKGRNGKEKKGGRQREGNKRKA